MFPRQPPSPCFLDSRLAGCPAQKGPGPVECRRRRVVCCLSRVCHVARTEKAPVSQPQAHISQPQAHSAFVLLVGAPNNNRSASRIAVPIDQHIMQTVLLTDLAHGRNATTSCPKNPLPHGIIALLAKPSHTIGARFEKITAVQENTQ